MKPGVDASSAGAGGIQGQAPMQTRGKANSALAFDLSCVTFTGVDDSADVTRICDISSECAEVEWGVLFHPDRAGRPRYASHKWINKLQDAVTRRKSESASGGSRGAVTGPGETRTGISSYIAFIVVCQ